MMKKITFLLFLLVASLGYSQTVLEDFEGTAPTIKITNDANGSVAIVADPETGGTRGNVLKLVTASGESWTQAELFMQGDHIDLRTASTDREVTVDIYSTTPRTFMAKVVQGTGADSAGNSTTAHAGGGWETITFDFTVGQDNTGAADGIYSQIYFFPFRDTPNGGWHPAENAEFYFDNITAIGFDTSNIDATLSDLKVDNVTIADFASTKETYTVRLPAGSTVVPTVTVVTSQGAASAVVTNATEIPGSTTVVVTAGDNTTTKTYTVTFEVDIVPTDAPPTPPTFNDSNNVISLYSDAYTAATTIANVPWDDSVFEEVTIAGNKVLKITGDNFIGMDLGDYLDATSMTHLHMDYWLAVDFAPGQVLNPKLSNHAAQAGETSAIDIGHPINSQDEIKNWQSKDFVLNGDRQAIKQFLVTQAGRTGLYYLDNVYMYVDGTASVENNELLGFSMYPNPASNRLNISAKETIQNADIFNVLGKKVMSLNINKTSDSIDVSNLSSGIYLVKYNVNGTVGTAKFIKE